MARKPILLMACAGLLMGTCAHARLSPQARRAEVDHLMSRYQGDVPGASLMVIKDGKAIVRRGYGYANLENHVKAGPETDYRMASISKQFTAVSIMLLKQDGTLGLDDPVRKWLPELPAGDAKVTLRDMLTHTSGLVDYESLIPPGRTRQIHDDDVLRMIASQHHLYFPPGHAHRYSNGAYVLLGLIVEKASGMDLADFMQKRIFGPLGMDHTLMYEHHRGPKPPHRAYGYSAEHGSWVRTDQSVTSATRGDGGVYTSIDDFAKWDASFYGNRLLTDASKTFLLTPSPPVADPDVNYGAAWRISGDTVWKSGETMGFRNVTIRWPQQHLTVIVFTNRNHPKPYPLALTIGELFLPH